jgi:ATP-dependent Clp protease ATP-binding subunit ClpA
MKKIVDMQLNLLKERLKKQSLDLEVSEKVKDHLLKVVLMRSMVQDL